MKATGRNTVPPQHTGIKTDVMHTVTCSDTSDAKVLFDKAKERLLHVSDWKAICGKSSADFMLTDANGQTINRAAQRGDKFRIDIPAPGTRAGNGYDWVEVEEISIDSAANSDSVAMRVRPTVNPLTPPDENDTAHFYTGDATSTFIVQRVGDTVTAEIHGRNEKPNTSETNSLLDKARNALVAIGAIAGLHKPQWNALAKGLLRR